MNRIAPRTAPRALGRRQYAPVERATHAPNRSSFPEDRLYCQQPTAIPPHTGLAHPDAIAAHPFVSENDAGCLLYAPVFAPGGAR